MKCDTDPNCLGITFPYRDDDSRQDAWFSDKKGVAVCKNKTLLNKPEKDWNVYQKCSASGSAGCFNKIEPLDGKWCQSRDEPSNYQNICDGTRTDCVSKGRMKCDTDPNCLGITFPYRDDDSRQDAWFSDKKGVAVCKSKILLNKPEKDWNVYQKCSGSGLLVAGGIDNAGNKLDQVELFNLETMTSCEINVTLDSPRFGHTGAGDLVCSGWVGSSVVSNCYNILTGNTINLINKRDAHISWSSDAGIHLMGGSWGSIRRATELITGNTTKAGFALKYDTTYSCGFVDEDDQTFIVTGGYGTSGTTVGKYNQNGWMNDDPPNFNTKRGRHGCGSYLDTNNNRVYLVTGGIYLSTKISSTELLVKGVDTVWTTISDSLPGRIWTLKSISYNNEIFISGGQDSDANQKSDKVLKFNKVSRKFDEIGKLKEGRDHHSMSLVDFNDYTCTELLEGSEIN